MNRMMKINNYQNQKEKTALKEEDFMENKMFDAVRMEEAGYELLKEAGFLDSDGNPVEKVIQMSAVLEAYLFAYVLKKDGEECFERAVDCMEFHDWIMGDRDALHLYIQTMYAGHCPHEELSGFYMATLHDEVESIYTYAFMETAETLVGVDISSMAAEIASFYGIEAEDDEETELTVECDLYEKCRALKEKQDEKDRDKDKRKDKQTSSDGSRNSEYKPVNCLFVPRELFNDVLEENRSLEAVLLYSLFLERKEQAAMNGWIDAHGEPYVIFPKKDMMKQLNSGRYKIDHALDELIEEELLIKPEIQEPGKAVRYYVYEIDQ